MPQICNLALHLKSNKVFQNNHKIIITLQLRGTEVNPSSGAINLYCSKNSAKNSKKVLSKNN